MPFHERSRQLHWYAYYQDHGKEDVTSLFKNQNTYPWVLIHECFKCISVLVQWRPVPIHRSFCLSSQVPKPCIYQNLHAEINLSEYYSNMKIKINFSLHFKRTGNHVTFFPDDNFSTAVTHRTTSLLKTQHLVPTSVNAKNVSRFIKTMHSPTDAHYYTSTSEDTPWSPITKLHSRHVLPTMAARKNISGKTC